MKALRCLNDHHPNNQPDTLSIAVFSILWGADILLAGNITLVAPTETCDSLASDQDKDRLHDHAIGKCAEIAFVRPLQDMYFCLRCISTCSIYTP